MRFTLGKMFLAIAMLALACAGIRYCNQVWESILISATIALFVSVGLCTAAMPTGTHRFASIVFVVVGVLYLLLATFPPFAPYSSYLVTNYPLAAIARERLNYSYEMSLARIIELAYRLNSDRSMLFIADAQQLFHIGHCVFSWIFALLAAWFAGRMYDRRERVTKEAA